MNCGARSALDCSGLPELCGGRSLPFGHELRAEWLRAARSRAGAHSLAPRHGRQVAARRQSSSKLEQSKALRATPISSRLVFAQTGAEQCGPAAQHPTPNTQHPTSNIQWSSRACASFIECWVLDVECWMVSPFFIGCWVLDVECWMFSPFFIGCWVLDVECWMFSPFFIGCWMLDVGCWVLDVPPIPCSDER